MDTIIRPAVTGDLAFLVEHDRHVTPAELDNIIRLGYQDIGGFLQEGEPYELILAKKL